MGYYVNQNSHLDILSANNKVNELINDGAIVIEKPDNLIPNLVCVIRTPAYDSACYVYNHEEMSMLSNSADARPKTWMIYEHAPMLSGYIKR